MSKIARHAPEHEELMQLVVRLFENFELIEDVVVVTLGFDGRVIVGSSMNEPSETHRLLREVGAWEDKIEFVEPVEPTSEH